MHYSIKPLTQEEALTIAYEWHYEKPYDFYDMEADEEDLAMFIDPAKRGDRNFSVYASKTLVGFFSVNEFDESTVSLGLGMHPQLTGKGNSEAFLNSIFSFIRENYAYETLSISVATFNKRAIRAYEKVGFKALDTFMQKTNGSTFEFLKMEREI